jgi:very-short-patch-repair endonuclease
MPQSTPEAKALMEALRRRGWKVLPENPDGHKSIDLSIPDAMVDIEVDGSQHFDKKQALADIKRTYYSFKDGWITLRIPNPLVKDRNMLEETADCINDILNESEDQLDEEEGDEAF